MNAVSAALDAAWTWVKSWRASKAGAELPDGVEAGRVIDANADAIAAELAKKRTITPQ